MEKADFTRTVSSDKNFIINLNDTQDIETSDPIANLIKTRVEISQAYEKSFRSTRWHVTPNEENWLITKIAKWALYILTGTLIINFADWRDGKVPTLSQILLMEPSNFEDEKLSELQEKLRNYQQLKQQIQNNPLTSPLIQSLTKKVLEENEVAYVQGASIDPALEQGKYFSDTNANAINLINNTTIDVSAAEKGNVINHLTEMLKCNSYEAVEEYLNNIKKNAKALNSQMEGISMTQRTAEKAFDILTEQFPEKMNKSSTIPHINGATKLKQNETPLTVQFDEEKGTLTLGLRSSLYN